MAVREREIRVERRPAPRFTETWSDEPPIGDLFRQLSDDATTLIRQEVALGKAEIRETARALGKDAVKIGVAVGMAVVGGLAALAFVIIALGDLLDSYWLSALIVAVVFFAIAAVLGKQATSDLQNREMKPTRTIDSLHADADWAKGEAEGIKREWKS
ncbi:MAG: phage holin family protein [Gemmatimonadota bacterium]